MPRSMLTRSLRPPVPWSNADAGATKWPQLLGQVKSGMDTTFVARRHRVTADLQERIDRALARALAEDWVDRIWARDASLWTDDPRTAELIGKRLGWLDVPTTFDDQIETLQAFGEQMRASGFTGGLVCGMGGSSLAPEVLASAMSLGETGIPVRSPRFDRSQRRPCRFNVIRPRADALPDRFSKSGTTTETLAFLAHFWRLEDDIHADIPQRPRRRALRGHHGPGQQSRRDPAQRPVPRGIPEPGGCRWPLFSALTYVGLVPAALMGHNLRGAARRRGGDGRAAPPSLTSRTRA